MRSSFRKLALKKAVFTLTILLLAAGASFAQSVTLTATSQTTTLPDGNSVPMWGWVCGTSTGAVTCMAMNGSPQAGGTWQPPLITVQTGSGLTINLSNSLPVATSLFIVGQLPGGGLGNPVRESGPRTGGAHAGQTIATWPIQGGATFTPPAQGARARSFAPEAGPTNGSQAYVWPALKAGTYLIESGTYPSIQGPMGLYGVLVVTNPPATVGTIVTPGTAYSYSSVSSTGSYNIQYDSDVPLLLSEIDPAQNAAVAAAVINPGFNETIKWSRACGAAGNNTCYPAAVNFTPLYYMVNGVSFNPTAGATSAASISGTYNTGNVMLRLVNAGLKMHVPSVSGLSMSLIAEDGNVLPDVALAASQSNPLTVRVQNDVFLAAGKVYDVMVSPAATIANPSAIPPVLASTYNQATYQFFDRELSLSSGGTLRDSGMQTTLLVAGGIAPNNSANAKVNDDSYYVAPGVTLTVSNPGKGVIANDVYVSGVKVAPGAGPAFGALTLKPNGTFTYVPDSSWSPSNSQTQQDTFKYYANNNTSLVATVTLLLSQTSGMAPFANTVEYSSNVATMVKVSAPGVLASDTDPNNYPLTAAFPPLSPTNNLLSIHLTNGGTGYSASPNVTIIDPTGINAVVNATVTGGVITDLLISSQGTGYTSPTVSISDVGTGASATASISNTVYAAGPVTYANGSSTATLSSDGTTITLMPDGSFTAVRTACLPNCSGAIVTFPHVAVNSEKVSSLTNSSINQQIGTVSLTFNQPSGLMVTVQDAGTSAPIGDYKWIIEQDLTFKIDPALQVNNGTIPPTLGTNFHTSYMPVIASGCTGDQSCERGQTVYDNQPACTSLSPNLPAGCSPTGGQHVPAVCEGTGICVPGPAGTHQPVSTPDQVYLPANDPTGRPASYYVSILPGDAANSFNTGNASAPAPDPALCGAGTTPTQQAVASICGHTMSGAPIAAGQLAVTVNVQPNPIQPATVTAYVFEDDWPLNGEPDAGGGVDVLATQEVPLDDFQITLWDSAGYSGDATGQMTYDMLNQPLTNALNGTIDPSTGLDACPISNNANKPAGSTALVGVIIVCPRYESDGKTPSPITGQAVVKNLMPGRFGIIAHPGAARTARGEEWLQTNTLDGTHFQDSFIRPNEPSYFQEFGPGGYHVFFGEANPAIINARKAKDICVGVVAPTCNNTIVGQVTNLHMARPPNEYLSDSLVNPVSTSGDATDYAALAHTTCYVSLGDPDGETFSFTKCDQNGHFTFTGVPDGDWALVVFDQWLDLIVDGTSKAVTVGGGETKTVDYSAFTWQTHIWSNTFLDTNGNGIQDPGEPGLLQVPSRIRMRNGKINNTLLSDINGLAHFNETFPLFSWYVTESDNTRFKNTGVHVVYDSGGTVDGPSSGCNTLGLLGGPGTGVCGNGNDTPYKGILNSTEAVPVPNDLRVPGAYYCSKADCTDLPQTLGAHPVGGPGGSTGRIDPGTVVTEGLQGFLSQTQIIDWGKQPYQVGETGGIRGHVAYASTRPFDDPSQQFQNLWEPLVPGVTMNLYKEGTAPDGTQSLQLIDTTTTSSWDAWSQGFRADGVTPNMSCPGQAPDDPFLPYTLSGTANYLTPSSPLPYNSQFKCFDSLRVFNQVQPAPYDGLYQFPTTSCTNCGVANLLQSNGLYVQTLNLLAGKYVVEVVPPAGYEIVKEEDKNILIGDNYIAPVTQQFGAMSNIFIVPDQATINNGNPAYGSGGGATDPTIDLGHTLPSTFGPGGAIVITAPCVGTLRIVPDYMSISPESGEVAPFAGASRNLCNRKEVTLEDQMQAQTDFFVWTKTPAASHFTGFILDDFSSEFDPASPAYGEKFAVPNLPISIKDFNGKEVSRLYSDQWGIFNGMTYSTWEVNPPNPTGYAPNMMITCMNDPGPIPDPANPGQMITDPLYNPAYSNFCYENPFMPADTSYLDTPVVPTTAFAEGYNPPDCSYPDATPAISAVNGDGIGPWVSAAGNTITITALGDQIVPNHAYSGPSATFAPYNQKTITRHYGFGNRGPNSSVTINSMDAPVISWSDMAITAIVPSILPICASSYNQGTGTPDQALADALANYGTCGQLVITADNGRQSIDAVTVTVGGKAPTYVAAGTTIQSAIDQAAPGDLIMVAPGVYTEMLLMWKPVRLQGVGAASVTVNANTHPSGKLLEPWRRQVNCLFGLALNGGVSTGNNTGTINGKNTGGGKNPYDPNYPGTSGSFACSTNMQDQVDPVPLEAVVGWDASTNGNLAGLLQEPTLMGAYEGSAITVLGKGLVNPAATALGQPEILLTNSAADCAHSGNFFCAPSRIDGITFSNSSQGGGGVFLHGWNHYTEVSNNRIHGNAGTLSGGITVGQPEANEGIFTNGVMAPYLWNQYVYIHNNAVTYNSSYGDELNSTTPAAAGGVTFCLGSDYYRFNYNWVCGNLSTGDGGGFSHYGFSDGGVIEHNSFLFNQSYNTTITTHGGGVILQGGPPDGAVCEAALVDKDCAPGLTDGLGHDIVFNANLVMGNTAESGSGGGLRLQNVNGNDVLNNPTNPDNWYHVSITNNIIVNNVAGWIGGGVSVYDAVRADFINNTIVSNDDTASAGVLFDTLGAPHANQPPPGCDPVANPNCTGQGVVSTNGMSSNEPAGLASEQHSPVLKIAFAQPIVSCQTPEGLRPNCDKFSNPVLANNLIWQNRAFHISNTDNKIKGLQTVVTLVPQLNQVSNNVGVTGGCPTGASYWDIGVYGDKGAGDHTSNYSLNPLYSILDDSGYDLSNLTPANAGLVSQYCNGSRVPPEIAPMVCLNNGAPGCNVAGGITVPPGVADINPFYPLFTLNPAATTDEGNNFINMFYGPLSLSNATVASSSANYNVPLGNYGLAAGSPAIDAIAPTASTYTLAPAEDFFGNPRSNNAPTPTPIDIGAVEFAPPQGTVTFYY